MSFSNNANAIRDTQGRIIGYRPRVNGLKARKRRIARMNRAADISRLERHAEIKRLGPRLFPGSKESNSNAVMAFMAMLAMRSRRRPKNRNKKARA